jgi:hypothetical protein
LTGANSRGSCLPTLFAINQMMNQISVTGLRPARV